ncbi:hypothetical protein EAJG_00328 [Escherichia coli E267]|nr:hypothetical protein EALG_00252 [Escherichia coli TA144]OSK37993.1 hypothetical protein EAJG_00328 [Escherichia coli E267]
MNLALLASLVFTLIMQNLWMSC